MEIFHTKLKCRNTRRRLREILDRIERETNDKPHETEDCQNLICPDLYCIQYDADIDDSTSIKKLKKKYGNSKSMKKIEWPNVDCKIKDRIRIRIPDFGYRMCPSVIKITINRNAIIKNEESGMVEYNEYDPKSYNISFISKIFGISNANHDIYVELSNVLCQIYPYIRKILRLSKQRIVETRFLQIIVKAQVYNIDYNKRFSGKYHMDGALERVMCGVAWYYKIDSNLLGGKLIFRAAYNESENAILYYDERTNDMANSKRSVKPEITQVCDKYESGNRQSVDIEENDIVLWNQEGLVHRVGDITQNIFGDEREQYWEMRREKMAKGEPLPCYQRGFVNFFIIDPSFLLPRTSLNTPNPIDENGQIKMRIIAFLQINIDKYVFNNKHMTPLVICNQIYEMTFAKSRTLEESKQIRQKVVRHRMDKTGREFKYIHQGNDGYYEYMWDWECRSDDGYDDGDC